jgi:hypothetical protein
MQSRIELAIPTTGAPPYFGIGQDSTILQPADPALKAIFVEMSDLLWVHAKGPCLSLMEDAARFRQYLDDDPTLIEFFHPDAPVGETEWIDSTAVEVHDHDLPALGSGQPARGRS